MGLHFKYFDSIEHLEPKCHGCGQTLVYGVTTEYSEDSETHVCLNCGRLI